MAAHNEIPENGRRIRDPEGGSNQSGLRDQNARLVLSFIRRHGAMASAEIARRSGLSAQTVSNIIRALEADGLLMRGEAVRGKVGKPSTPVALDPRGALSFGLNVGRRSAELVLVDFTGARLDSREVAYPYPSPDIVFPFLTEGIDEVLKPREKARASLTGIGVAAPYDLESWGEIMRAPDSVLAEWANTDIGLRVAELTGIETTVENDATSACVAEHLLGLGSEYSDFAYFFIGAFIGGGLVLNGRVFSGRTGNAGAFGSLPVPAPKGGTTQLLKVASLHVLESTIAETGRAVDPLRHDRDDWSAFEDDVAPWIEQTAEQLAVAAAAVTAVVETEAVLIDGALPRDVLDRLVQGATHHLQCVDLTGISRPVIRAGTVGRTARSIGAALLPIHARYFVS